MKNITLVIISIVAVLLVAASSSLSVSRVAAEIDGFEIWQDEGFIIYEIDIQREIGDDYTSVYDVIDINNAELMVQYKEKQAGQMVFEESSDSSALQDYYGVSSTGDEFKVDPDTGLNAVTENPTATLYDVSDFAEGYKSSDHRLEGTYSDDAGDHSINEKFEVTKESTVDEVKVEGASTSVRVWELALENFELQYTHSDVDYTQEWDIVYKLSAKGGTWIGYTYEYTWKIKTTEDSSFKLIYKYFVHWVAIEIEGVDVLSSGGLFGLPIPGFEYLMVTCSLVFVGAIYCKLKRKGKN